MSSDSSLAPGSSGPNHTTPAPAHIDTLPVEIFQKILLMALPPTYFSVPHGREVAVLDGRVEAYRKETFILPIRVSQVSSRWRKLALSCGDLWSYLFVTFTPIKAEWTVKAFDTFIERTNGGPLNFGFSCDLRGVTNAQVHEAGSKIVMTLLKEQRRWNDVRFRWTHLNIPDDFPEIQLTDTPTLTSLYLESYLYGRSKGQYWAEVSDIPSQVQRLILRGYFIPATNAEQLPKLTSCTFGFHNEPPEAPAAEICLNFLKAAPNLRSFSCNSGYDFFYTLFPEDDDDDGDDAPELGGPTIDHNLESLELVALKDPPALLGRLRLPALKRLVYDDGSETSAQTLLELIRHSDPLLTYLEFRSVRVKEAVLLDALRLLPELEDLHLSGFSVSAQFLRALDMKNEASTPLSLPDEDKTIICPRLKSLRLRWMSQKSRDLEACTDALFSLIQSRHAHKSFQSVVLGRGSRPILLPLTEANRARLKQELEKDGTGDILIGEGN